MTFSRARYIFVGVRYLFGASRRTNFRGFTKSRVQFPLDIWTEGSRCPLGACGGSVAMETSRASSYGNQHASVEDMGTDRPLKYRSSELNW